MHIFHRRPLFLCCSVFLLASVAGFFLVGWGKLAVGAVMLLGTAGYSVWALRRRDALRGALAGVACLLALAALLQSHLYFHSGAAKTFSEMEGETVTVTGVILDRRGSGGYLTSYALELDSLNGEKIGGTALLTCHYVSDLQVGYGVNMQVKVQSLTEAAGDGYDATALLGDGFLTGLLSEDEADVVITGEDMGGLAVKAGRLRRTLSARLDRSVGDGGHGLPSALLLGDKSYLEDSIRRDFTRAGVSHLLAISGLHMTLLFGLFEGLLRLLRVGKRLRAGILSLCAVGYLALLGFPPSATRAVIMLGAVYLSYVLFSRTDALTSLGLAGAVILAVTPYAVADAGFWMSYLATLGLVAVLPALRSDRKGKDSGASLLSRIRAGLGKLLMGIAVGFVAMSMTLVVVAAVIGEMGVLSPVSTLLLTPLCGCVLVVSLLVLPLGGSTVGAVLGGLDAGLCGVMGRLTAWMATPSWAVVSLKHSAVLPLAFCMLAGILILLTVRLPRARRWTVALPLVAGWIAIGGVLGVHTVLNDGSMAIRYLQPSSQADALVLAEGHEAVICDLGNGSLTSLSHAAREAERMGSTEIAVLMLTHYHSRTVGSLSAILGRETVRELWLPAPEREEDYYLLLAYLEKAEAAGVPVCLYGEGEELTLFSDCRVVLETDFIKRSVQPVLLLSLDAGDGGRLVYCGSAVFESELADTAASLAAQADTVIFGNHGPLIKASYGGSLTLRKDTTIVFSAEGDGAGWFEPSSVDGQEMWIGEWRGTARIRD